MRLPDPADRPLLRPDELIGILPGMGRSAIYEALRRGDLPSIRVGRRRYVPNQALRVALGLNAGDETAPRRTGLADGAA